VEGEGKRKRRPSERQVEALEDGLNEGNPFVVVVVAGVVLAGSGRRATAA